MGGLDQQEAQERRSLLAEMAEALARSAAVLGGDQAGVAGHLPGRGEAFHWAEREHGGQRGDGADAGLVMHQVACVGPCFGFAPGHRVQLGDLRVPLVEQAQQFVAPALGPGRQGERLQLLAPVLAPQLAAPLQAAVQSDGLELVLDRCAHGHQLVAVHEQLAQIAGLAVGHPDAREPFFFQQLQQQLGVAPVGLLLARRSLADAGRVADPQLVAELFEQLLEPQAVPARLQAHSHRVRQGGIEPPHLIAVVGQAQVLPAPSFRLQQSDLL